MPDRFRWTVYFSCYGLIASVLRVWFDDDNAWGVKVFTLLLLFFLVGALIDLTRALKRRIHAPKNPRAEASND